MRERSDVVSHIPCVVSLEKKRNINNDLATLPSYGKITTIVLYIKLPISQKLL